MKKILTMVILAVLLAGFVILPAAAKSPVLKGEVTALDAVSLTILTRRGESVVITPPVDFDLTSLVIGDTVLARGQYQENGTFVAELLFKIDLDTEEEPGEGEEAAEGGKAGNAAFCDPEKQQVPHPMATRLAEKYAVTPDWVMGYYCDGYSIGAIFLALKTGELTSVSVDDLLADRAGGKSWGAIWQELKMIGKEKDAFSPPGQLKKLTP